MTQLNKDACVHCFQAHDDSPNDCIKGEYAYWSADLCGVQASCFWAPSDLIIYCKAIRRKHMQSTQVL